MARVKQITNGNGTELTISTGRYICIGKDGNDVMLKGNGRTLSFNTWDDMMAALDISKAAYVNDETGTYVNNGAGLERVRTAKRGIDL